MSTDPLARVLEQRGQILDGARAAAVDKQHAAGKLTARERLDRLLDGPDRQEYGGLVTPDPGQLAKGIVSDDLDRGLDAPADGLVLATGLIDGRPVVATAWDYTVHGGTYSSLALAKLQRATQMALERGIPHVNLIESGGYRIHGMDNRVFAAGAPTFELAGQLSGWVPLVGAIMGPAFAGAPMFASTTDFVPMVKGTASLGMAGPRLVERGTGGTTTLQQLDSTLQLATGVVDVEADDDPHCLDLVRQFLAYLPSNAELPPPAAPAEPPAADRAGPALRDAVPGDRRQAYDVRRVLDGVLDGGVLFELLSGFAKNLTVGLGRVAGRAVGVVANQPRIAAGSIDADACSKATRFVSLCDAFGLPILSFIDTPGVMVGLDSERRGVSRYLGKLLLAWSQVTVPVVTVTLRKGYGAGYVSMAGGRNFSSAAALIWPSAEICAMGIEGAVDVAFKRDLAESADPEARRLELVESFYDQVTPERAASGFGVDDVIDPASTRDVLSAVLRVSPVRRHRWEPPRRHPIPPI